MALTEKREDQIILEESLDNKVRTKDKTAAEKEFRGIIRRDVKKMKAAGLEVVMPLREPGP